MQNEWEFRFFFLSLCFLLSFIPDSEIPVRKVIFPSCGREVPVKFRWVISEGWDSYSLQTPTKRETSHRLWSLIHGHSTKKPSKIFSVGQWSRFLAFLNTSQAFCMCSSGTLGFPISFHCFGTFLPMSSVVFKACALLIEKAVCLPMKFHHSHSPPWKPWAQHL